MKTLFSISLLCFIPSTILFCDTNIEKEKLKGGINSFSSETFIMPRSTINGMYNNFSNKLSSHLEKNKIKQKNKTSKSIADIVFPNTLKVKIIDEKKNYKILKQKK